MLRDRIAIEFRKDCFSEEKKVKEFFEDSMLLEPNRDFEITFVVFSQEGGTLKIDVTTNVKELTTYSRKVDVLAKFFNGYYHFRVGDLVEYAEKNKDKNPQWVI